MNTRSLYKSYTGIHFYGTENEIKLVLGRLATLKKNGVNYEQPLRTVFSSFQEQKKYLLKKICGVRTKKLHNIPFKIFFF